MTVHVRRSRRTPPAAPLKSISNLSHRERAILERTREAAQGFENKLFAEMYVTAVERKLIDGDDALYKFMGHLDQAPVDINTFLDDDEFLGATDLSMWPEVRAAIVGINEDWWKGLDNGAKIEALLKGATGTGKTTIAMVTTLYHLHLLGCLKQPQAVYGLPKTTAIVFPIMAAKPHVTKKVVYRPLRKLFEDIPWFQKHMRLDTQVESEIDIKDKNIRVVVGGADEDSILGEAVIGGIIDEINFMNIVLRSKKSEATSGRSGLYDQAKNIYEAMVGRKKGRFISKGPCIGVVVVSSSTRYAGDFTDKREEHVKKVGEKGVYIYNKKQYEVWPQDRYSGKTFRLLVGNDTLSDTRVLGDNEEVPNGALVLDVPVEYKDDFIKNPHRYLRDVIGMSTTSVHPFIRRRFTVLDCIQRGEEEGLESFLEKDNVELGRDGMPRVKRGHYCANPSRPRYVHIDLALNNDSCGIAMLRFDGLRKVEREGGMIEMLPEASVELACSIRPDGNNEIQIAEVRMWVKQLRDVYGYPIKVVTYDGAMSIESRQQWKKEGAKTGYVSVDKTSVPYKQLRDAFSDGRVKMYQQQVLVDELFGLEYDGDKDKVDHPVNGSKDVADAVCGAYTTLIQRRSSWRDAAADDEANAASLRADFEDRLDEPRPD